MLNHLHFLLVQLLHLFVDALFLLILVLLLPLQVDIPLFGLQRLLKFSRLLRVDTHLLDLFQIIWSRDVQLSL